MTVKPFSEYAERNAGAILDVLQSEFCDRNRVLEVGSGTGQHAVRFARALAHLQWQTSDLEENLGGISAWVDDADLANLPPPLSLDVLDGQTTSASYDAGFSANTAHIMTLGGVRKMFELFGNALSAGGVMCLYGPFRQGGEFNTESNAEFHRMLRSRNPGMGIRHLESLDDYAHENTMKRIRLYSMPANNHIAVWSKEAI